MALAHRDAIWLPLMNFGITPPYVYRYQAHEHRRDQGIMYCSLLGYNETENQKSEPDSQTTEDERYFRINVLTCRNHYA